MGLHSDNYAGIYNLNFQPADIVDSRYRFDMNIIQTEFNFVNNYMGVKKRVIFPKDTVPRGMSFAEYNLHENLNGKVKKLSMESNTMLPLSFYFQFGKNMKNAIGFSSRARINTSVGGVDEKFAQQIYSGLEVVDLYNVGIQNKNLSVQTAAWSEVGLTYGREIIDLGNHYIKGAFTGKMNQGFASLSLFSDNLDATFTSDSTASVRNSDVQYDMSTNFLDFSTSANPEMAFKFRPTFSADFGFVYEWRPDIDDYKYELDGNPNKLDPKKNKYKLKASLAFTDIGFLKFERSPYSKTLQANFNDVTTKELGRLVEDFETGGIASIDSAFNNSPSFLGTSKDNVGTNYMMRLPFKINAMVDYHIWKGFYVNATASIAPNFKKDAEKNTGLSQFSLTPRYEHRWFGAQLPVSIDGLGRAHLGLGLRAGPLVVGVADVIPLVAGKKYNMYAANVYVGLKIPIFARIKDKDKDHVSDKMDNCKKVPGTWATLGCPDTDGDGVTDDVDECPDVFGTKEMKGCPDTDGDGITDAEDKCPEVAGLAEFGGCPDTDGDGIQDSEDECPEVAGLAEFAGCPDTDGDGIRDVDDKCPTVAGPKENNGCPYADTDGDGVIDIEDACPNTPGPKENNGCPVIKEEVKKAIQTAFDNLQFVSGKAVIKTSSLPSLQSLATIMKENPSFNLKIAGHTDSVGSDEANMTLSKERATAVKTYLVQNGVPENKFIIEAYGETMPIGDNDTEAGRQLNRRVEMDIIQN